ncbi:MAG: DUF2071 domain-containing protein [Saprospiraceae bacterium]|nr:DUF2071 domain-containing protein [Saprospiraceae bacterium]
MKAFLTAEWRNLILANYEFDPEILEKYLPKHTELDFWNGTCYVSLVGFLFQNTRVSGLRIPWHVNFPEVNLRFYVRHKNEQGEWQRGVVFIKEIVPRHAISLVANTLYGEHYQTMPMRYLWKSSKELMVSYDWKYRNKWHRLAVEADHQVQEMPMDSEEAFITEHYWGYTKTPRGSTIEYGVEHPRWRVHPVQSFDIEVDTNVIYGADFEHIAKQTPKSVFLAEGSPIIVRQGRKISR